MRSWSSADRDADWRKGSSSRLSPSSSPSLPPPPAPSDFTPWNRRWRWRWRHDSDVNVEDRKFRNRTTPISSKAFRACDHRTPPLPPRLLVLIVPASNSGGSIGCTFEGQVPCSLQIDKAAQKWMHSLPARHWNLGHGGRDTTLDFPVLVGRSVDQTGPISKAFDIRDSTQTVSIYALRGPRL
jgi:hypothetical protein